LSLEFLLHLEVICSIGIDMLESSRREIGDVGFQGWSVFPRELFDDRMHGDGVPDNDGIADKVKAKRLMGLLFRLFVPDLPLVSEEEKASQRMQGLAFVELEVNAASVLFTLQVPQDEEGFDESASPLAAPE
jgi:hypothetical protein